MLDRTEFVQPIALLRAGTHEDAVAAVCRASVGAYLNTADHPAWQQWLDQSFAKSVRRARGNAFVMALPLAECHASTGNAQALGFLPTSYVAMPETVRKMQVGGTEFERVGWGALIAARPLSPVVLLTDSATMSTGKAAAQAAHGLFSWFLGLSVDHADEWVRLGTPFSVRGVGAVEFEEKAGRAACVITDAGRTEVAPGTMTALVLER